MFERVQRIVCEECNITPDKVRPETNIVQDLGLDSLTLLDVVYRLDKELGIEIPVQDWLNEIGQHGADPKGYFVLTALTQRLEQLLLFIGQPHE